MKTKDKDSLRMEGMLWKWTNYFSGWQPRWFVLDNGILSYYKSLDDVRNGCKGSVKMSVCDVVVHPTDNTRLDLMIPGEAQYFVKAATPKERQQWLVALGSCKASLTLNGRPVHISEQPPVPEDELRIKKSELRLYCDLLMQQVHSVKTSVKEEKTPNVAKLDEATSLLSATCDTFIHTLEECMRIANANNTNSYESSPKDSIASSPKRNSLSGSPWGSGPSLQRSTSVDRWGNLSLNSPSKHIQTVTYLEDGFVIGYIPPGLRPPNLESMRFANRSNSESSAENNRIPHNLEADFEKEDSSKDLNNIDEEEETGNGRRSEGGDRKRANRSVMREDGRRKSQQNGASAEKNIPDKHMENIKTFFSQMSTSFMDIHLQNDGGVPVLPFLEACRNILEIFDKLNPHAFSPVKIDVGGNIKKIQQKYNTDPDRFRTLQSLVSAEIAAGQYKDSSSATEALLWLRRALWFIKEFLQEVLNGTKDLSEGTSTAYTKSLKQFHGWVVRGVFALALKAVPTREEFINALAIEVEDIQHPKFEQKVLKDMEAFVTAEGVVLKILNDYYEDQGLSPDGKP